MTKEILYLQGMHCPSCEGLVKDIVQDCGAKATSANYKAGKVEVDYDPKKTTIEKIKKAIETEGDNYKVK